MTTRILIVEDDLIVANNLKDRLKGLGHSVCGIASTAQAAVSEAADTEPDLILMDIKLRGETDGITAAEQIRSDFDIPLIFLTGYADSTTLQRAKLTNPYGYILKPFEVRELHTGIEMALHSHAMARQLRESEERYRNLVENSLQGILVIQGYPPRITFANARCAEIVGCSQDDLLGMSPEDVFSLIHPEDQTWLVERIQAFTAGDSVPITDEFRVVRRDETERWVTYFASPIERDGEPAHQVALVDISQRKEAEEALMRAHHALEERVEQRTSELAHRNEQLKQEIVTRRGVEKSLKERNLELAILNSLGHRVNASLSLAEVVETTLDDIADTLAPDLAMMFLYEQDGLRLRGLRPKDAEWQSDAPGVHHVGECLCGLAASGKAPVLSDNLHIDPRCSLNECKAAGMLSFAALPLLRGGEVLGVLGLASAKERDFTGHTAFLAAVANTVAVGVQNAVLHQELHRHADDLARENLDRKQAEEALRNSEERYRFLFERNLSGVYRSTVDGEILECNEAFARILGYDTCQQVTEVQATTIYSLPKDRTTFLASLQTEGSLTNMEWCLKRKDGSPVWCLENASLVQPEVGGPQVIQGTIFDITERKTMEQALAANEERYRSLFSNIPLCIFELDLTQNPHTIVRCNDKAVEVYGWSAEEFSSFSVQDLFAEGGAPSHLSLKGEIVSGRSVSLESVHRRKDGSMFPVRFSAAPVASDERSRVILAVEDITAEATRRSEEDAIAEERHRIAREIHDGLAQNLASLRFQARLWHNLIDDDPQQMHTRVDEMREFLKSQIHEVRRSIFALRPIALDELGFDRALDQFVVDFGEQNQIAIELRVSGPRERMPAHLEPVVFRIVQEALNNVRKHAGTTKAWIDLDLRKKSTLTLVVRDYGLGFDLADLADAPRYGHFGLRQMSERVEELDGLFLVESQPGEGTTVRVALPIAPL